VGEIVVGPDDPAAPEIVVLLERHLEFAYANSPHADVHALDATRLTAPNISFFSAREAGRVLGVGAMKELDPSHGELKSMHTAIEARGRGVGRCMVDHLIKLAVERGYSRVSLETGAVEAFIPALSLYRSVGFIECGPFADYRLSPNSTFMTLELSSSEHHSFADRRSGSPA
jgi:putative acetyltransferase